MNNIQTQTLFLNPFLPFYFICLIFIFIIIINLINTNFYIKYSKVIILISIFFVFLFCIFQFYTLNDKTITAFNGMLLSNFNSRLILLILFIVSFFCLSFNDKNKNSLISDDFLILSLSLLIGAMLMIIYNHLLILFLGLEILSFSLYALIGSNSQNISKTFFSYHEKTTEATIKYFFINTIFTCFLLLGISLIYVTFGSFKLNEIIIIYKNLNSLENFNLGIFYIGLSLIVFTFLFKIAIFPFHFWLADVYQGSPTATTTLMITVVKIASIAGLLRFFDYSLNHFDIYLIKWNKLFYILVILTMSIANISALLQKNPKRILAYSSLSHASFIILAFRQYNQILLGKYIFYYLSFYTVASLVCFGILQFIEKDSKDDLNFSENLSLTNLYKKNFFLACNFSLALIVLMGLPPFGGFFAKYFILQDLFIKRDYIIALIILINTFLSSIYYMRMIMDCFTKTKLNNEIKVNSPIYFSTSLIILNFYLLFIGVYPYFLF